jgi:integrase
MHCANFMHSGLECLSSIFSMAMRKPHRLTSENPCREVTKLKEENQRNRYLTADEEDRLLAACVGDRAHLRPIIIMALNTGMRRGEILSEMESGGFPAQYHSPD